VGKKATQKKKKTHAQKKGGKKADFTNGSQRYNDRMMEQGTQARIVH